MDKSKDFLAIARTQLANQRTLLAYIRTSFYFLGLGLTIIGIDSFEKLKFLAIPLFVTSPVVIIIGLLLYYKEKRNIEEISVVINSAQ